MKVNKPETTYTFGEKELEDFIFGILQQGIKDNETPYSTTVLIMKDLNEKQS